MSDVPAGIDRRAFVRTSVSTLGGLWVGVTMPHLPRFTRLNDAVPPAATAGEVTVFIRIDPGNRIVIGARGCEIGQGVRTSLPMIIAEELDVPWEMVTVEQLDYALVAGPGPNEFREKYGAQDAGGSTSVADGWLELRLAGAQARWLLRESAARRWNATASSLSTRDAFVLHGDGRRLSYGELARDAAAIPPPAEPIPLKKPEEFRVVGTRVRVADAAAIVRGRASFGIDARMPGALVAVMARSPYFEGKLVSMDDRAARRIPGVRDVVVLRGPAPGEEIVHHLADGVAVVADDTWSAMKGREALRIEWDRGAWASDSMEALEARCNAGLAKPGVVARRDGDVAAARAGAARVVEARYTVPFLAHATMEPPNCTVDIRDGRATVIASMQNPGSAMRQVTTLTGIPRQNVEIRLPRSGGGFGRRLESDYVGEAVKIALQVKRPVKLIWTRDDDIQHDFYRPFGVHSLFASLDASGAVTGWSHRVAATSRKFRSAGRQNAEEWLGVCDPHAYPAGTVPNYESAVIPQEFGLAPGWWRGPLHTFGAFATESFIDEVAHATGRDAVELRLALLGPARRLSYRDHGGPHFDTGRLACVLREAERLIGWGSAPASAGRGRGIACHFTFGGYTAHAMEVSVTRGRLTIHRCLCVVDVGQPVNPLGIEAQIMGGTLDGISAAMRQEITVREGRVQQRNFSDYRLLRMADAPDVEVYIVPSTVPPVGAGEMGVPSAIPALTNAIAAATGKRIRRLPVAGQLA